MDKPQTARIERLEQDLKTAKNLVENNTQWNKKQLGIALFGFCYGKAEEDIVYALACMSGRHNDIVNELTGLIESLESKEEDNE